MLRDYPVPLVLALLLEVLQLRDDVGSRGLPHLFLVAEVVAQEVALHAGGALDVAHGHRVEAPLGELLERHFDQLAPRGFRTLLRPALAHRFPRFSPCRHL